ncbi:MAG: TlpA family protein disulfide reductase [Clostridiales bacterium]|nr:TlpA family protein disulfide reductase [Clostridiales bacterium]
MKKIGVISIIAICIFALAACGTCPAEKNKERQNEAKHVSSEGLQSFESTDLDGNPVNQDIFSGKKLTMVNMWATFCGPCIKEMPDLAELNKEYSDKGFQIVGIPVDVTLENGQPTEDMMTTAKSVVSDTGADYMHIVPSASLYKAKLSEVDVVPETIFVDENGKQVGRSYVGSHSKAKWGRIIDRILEDVE